MNSIESAYISDARFIAENFPNLSWNPLWYTGYAFHLFYVPALPYMVAGLHSLSGVSVASAYRIVAGLAYACTPAALFLLVYYLTRRRYPATVAALTLSIAPSFCYLISDVRNDAAGYGYAPWSLAVFLHYGEGPHITGLAFIPLAALGLMHAMRRPSLRNMLLAAIAISAVALTNVIALFALAVTLAVVIVSEMLVAGIEWNEEKGLLHLSGMKKLKTALACTLLSYGLCAFWYNISYIRAISAPSAGGITWNWLALTSTGLVTVGVLALCRRKPQLQPASIVGGSLLMFSMFVFGWYEMGIGLAPQPNRYMPEMNMAAAAAFGMVVDWSRRSLSRRKVRWARLSSKALTLAVLAIIVLSSIPFLQVAHTITRPNPDITTTSEYQVAQWLDTHVKGERAYVTGSHCFWLNVFANVPQIRGGSDGAWSNVWWSHVTYQINNGENGTIAILWSKALDIKYIVVSFPGAADAYHDYRYPGKFEGLLQKVYDDRGMAIYEVPLTRPEAALVVDLPSYDSLDPIRDAVDGKHLSLYVEQIEQSLPIKDYRIVNNDQLEFETDMGPQQAVLVRMAYDPGWQAYCNGQRVLIGGDLVGFMLIKPGQQGHCRFELQHVPLWDEWLGYALTAVTLVGVAAKSVVDFRRTRSLTD